MDDPKTLARLAYVKTYGCQMNSYDSERMQELLQAQGYAMTDQPAGADLVVLNTCHIREKAVEKIYSELGRLREMKAARQAQGSDMLIAVAGCVAQAEGEEIVRRVKEVDLVIGPQTYHRLPELLARRTETQRPVVETDFPANEKFEGLGAATPRQAHGHGVAAFLTVQEGCDKFCSFCVVPYTRGAEFSRPVAQVLQEAQSLTAKGVREITLLGQNVNAYRGDDGTGKSASLASLVAELSKIYGLDRIRYMTSHPRDMSDDLIAAHADNPKLMPFLHLPVQAGSDRILKAMNRGHTTADYEGLIAKIRKARPGIGISGDFIVGFPGETDADFEQTLALIGRVGYAQAYSFKYSPRPGTPAAEKTTHIADGVMTERLYRLQDKLLQQQRAFNVTALGTVQEVLVEKLGRNAGQVIGRSPYLQSVHMELSPSYIGRIVNVRIEAVGGNSLSGQYVGGAF